MISWNGRRLAIAQRHSNMPSESDRGSHAIMQPIRPTMRSRQNADEDWIRDFHRLIPHHVVGAVRLVGVLVEFNGDDGCGNAIALPLTAVDDLLEQERLN
jgi:hypothetical protein